MLGRDDFSKADIRIRQAKRVSNRVLGGLGVSMSGDLLQCPPVDIPSIAIPLNVASVRKGKKKARITEQQYEDGPLDDDDQKASEADADHKLGYELWRKFKTVISLTVNIRAPGLLGRLLTEMRNRCLSSDMWALYRSRILRDNDERLRQPPFSNHHVQYVVHRHRIRASQSYANAVRTCIDNKQRLYIVVASDTVRRGDQQHFTDHVRQQVLREVNPRQVKYLPGIQYFYIGMRLLLYSKDSVRFSLMKGCECILERIVFADEEVLPVEAVAGAPIELKFMPTSLILRAVDAPWILPPGDMPTLPPSLSRRGLFQLVPREERLKRTLAKDVQIEIRRVQFAVLPADTRVVYGAQGENWDATIPDMKKPPNMDDGTHWLACYVMWRRSFCYWHFYRPSF